jgi:hypothetical protein
LQAILSADLPTEESTFGTADEAAVDPADLKAFTHTYRAAVATSVNTTNEATSKKSIATSYRATFPTSIFSAAISSDKSTFITAITAPNSATNTCS